MKNFILGNLGRALRKLGFKDDGMFDARIQELQRAVRQSGGINFKIEHQSSGEWVAESTNIDGIITGGKDYPKDVDETVKDAIFTYYEIPPQLCNDALLRKEGEVSRVEERVYA